MSSEGYGSVGRSVGRSIGLSVCPLIEILPQERPFVLKKISGTQRASKVKMLDFSEAAPLQRYTASCIVWLSV